MKKPDSGQPIACTLNSRAFQERRAAARQAALSKVIAVKREPSSVTITFKTDKILQHDLENFVSLERECCGFLEFKIIPATYNKVSTELQIKGPPEAGRTLDMFADAATKIDGKPDVECCNSFSNWLDRKFQKWRQQWK